MKNIVRPTGALYIQNLDGEKDENGLVTSYFLHQGNQDASLYNGALYRSQYEAIEKSLLIDDEKDPYQMNNLSLEENKEVVKQLVRKWGNAERDR